MCKTGLTVLEDKERLTIGTWHTAQVVIDYGKASLSVDKRQAVQGELLRKL